MFWPFKGIGLLLRKSEQTQLEPKTYYHHYDCQMSIHSILLNKRELCQINYNLNISKNDNIKVKT